MGRTHRARRRAAAVAARAALLLASCLLATGGCTWPPGEDPAGAGAAGGDSASARPGVRAAVRQLVTGGGAPGAAALSEGRRVNWFGTAGVADLRDDRRMRRDDRFRAGSLTKTVVATVVLQLAGEGRIGLSDTVEGHLPGLVRGNGNDGRRITVRELLNHTSGLFDYTDDADLMARADATGRRPEQLVRAALRHRPYAPPGAAFRYSNTDYILLGLIVEQVTGRPYATEAERRVIRPLGLTGTSFPGARTRLPAPHGRGYAAPTPTATTRDVTRIDPSSAGAAGEMVSTLGDLSRFLRALLSGRLLRPEQLRQMRDTSGTDGTYGLGLFPVRLACGVTLWGHNGTIRGSYVQTLGTRAGGHVLSYRVNTDAVPSPRAQDRLLSAEFCPRGHRR